MGIYYKQLKSLLYHKWHVLKVGLIIGGIPLWRLIVHDWSKFTPIEFINYSHFKYGVKSLPEWAKAWGHHVHHNPHHPEHWILTWRGNPNFYDNYGQSIAPFVTALPMPATYAREMVADMMATSMEITGSYDIAVWFNKHGREMLSHETTITRIDSVLIELGYFLTDNCPFSYMAGEKTWKLLRLNDPQ